MGLCQSSHALSIDDTTTKGALPKGTSVVFVLGGPGSGKGTQCAKIAERYDCAHISAGDVLREEVRNGTDLGKECDALMKEGKLVPLETTLALLQSAMLKSTKKTFLIDGFPRAMDQGTRFEEEIQPCTAVLYFECSEEVMVKRLVERGKTSGRADDNEETIRKRLVTFREMSEPVAKFYEAQGKCFRLSGEEPPEIVFERVQSILDTYFKEKKPENASKMDMMEEKKTEDDFRIPAEKGPTEIQPVPSDEIPETSVGAHPAAESGDVTAVDAPSSRVVFVLGGPGSGKGTQCEQIVRDYGYGHISLGDLFRREVESGSDLGKECDALMKEGKLIPLQTTLDLLKKAMDSGTSAGYLIDGFPRSIEQAEMFEQHIGQCNAVLFFECSEAVMLERLSKRAEQSGRVDDNPETMQKRLATFAELSAPVARFYTDLGKCHTLSAERDPAEIYADVREILNRLTETNTETKPDATENVPAVDSAGDDAILLVWQKEESKTGEMLSAAMGEHGWRVVCRSLGDAVDVEGIQPQAILVDLTVSEVNTTSAVTDVLRQARDKGIVILPSLEAQAAATDEHFAAKITDKEWNDDAQKIAVHFAFDIPIDVITYPSDAEKSDGQNVTHLKPDDPEIAALVQQLVNEDLGKIRAETNDILPPIWSAVYDVVEGPDEAKDYVFRRLECMSLDLPNRLPFVESIAKTIAVSVKGQNA